jgi:hypothetical protein
MKYTYTLPTGVTLHLNDKEYKEVLVIHKRNMKKAEEICDGIIITPTLIEQRAFVVTMQEYVLEKMQANKK